MSWEDILLKAHSPMLDKASPKQKKRDLSEKFKKRLRLILIQRKWLTQSGLVMGFNACKQFDRNCLFPLPYIQSDE